MKERRKIFSAADMAAIRDGRKTMFREMVVPQPPSEIEYPPEGRDGWFCSGVLGAKDYGHGLEWTVGASWGSQPCPQRWLHLLPKLAPPLGTIGDRLWLPETWAGDKWCGLLYRADGVELPIHCEEITIIRWNPSITMPRWACRTFAEITGVCVERVQEMEGMDAASSDALKEGVNRIHHEGGNYYYSAFRNQPDPKNWTDPYLAFKELWQSHHGNWEANPWVWAYSIKLIKP